MTRLSDLYGKLLDGLAVIAALILLAMVLIVTGDIVLRNTVSKGFVWANEVSEYALYLITVLTAPWLLRRGQHVRLDLVLTAVPKRVALVMEAIGDIAGFVVMPCDGALRHAHDLRRMEQRLDHHQESRFPGMVAAGAPAGLFRPAHDRIRFPVSQTHHEPRKA